MAFTDPQISDLYYLLGYPARYRDTYAALENAIAVVLPTDTEARVIANITAAKAHITAALETLDLVGVKKSGSTELDVQREYHMRMGQARRCIRVISNDLGVAVKDDVTSMAAKAEAGTHYAPWG